MDDTFACPECGSRVKVGGLAPGRQVRCTFCRRLLEVPYLPRVIKTDWKRRRFGRPWWFVWAWAGIGLSATVILAVALSQGLARWKRARLDRSISDLISASEAAESEGDLGRALIELDAAIRLRADADGNLDESVGALRRRRQALNLREAAAVLDRLESMDAAEFPVGEWLNLKARVESDRELASLAPAVRRTLDRKLQQRVETLIHAAKEALEAAKPAAAYEACEVAWALHPQLDPDARSALRSRIEALLDQIIARHGIVVEPIRGGAPPDRPPREGSPAIPDLGRSLASKGYVPRPDVSPWRERWAAAPYRMVIDLDETHEGTYMMSENRLTRIDARLVLFHRGRPIWKTAPSARTRVPLPKLPAYVSGQLALSTKRSPEIERLLAQDANTLIQEKLAFALEHIPACGQQPQ